MSESAPNSSFAEPAVGSQPDFSAAEREARLREAIDHVAINRVAELAAERAPAKFALLDLMIGITLLAVMLGLVRSLGIIGALSSFILAIAWTNAFYPLWRATNLANQRAMFDATWAVLMPLVCLVFDPFVFKSEPHLLDGALQLGQALELRPTFRAESFAVYGVLLWQMVFLLLWLAAHPWLGRVAGFWLGTFAAGVLISGVVSVLLVIPATVGTFVGIGLLGFTPMFTTYALSRRLREAFQAEARESSDGSAAIFWLLAALGFMAAWIVPLLMAAQLSFLVQH